MSKHTKTAAARSGTAPRGQGADATGHPGSVEPGRPAAGGQAGSPGLKSRRALGKPPRVTRRPLRRRLQRARIPSAIALAIAAGGLTAYNSLGSTVDRVPAVRLTTDIGAGEVLTAESVEVAEVDVAAVPENHSGDPGRYIGQTMSAPLPRGAVVHESQLLGPGLLTGRDAGTVAVPVRPADTAIVGLLAPGQHVDVLASADAPENASSTRTVAEGVPVLWTPQGGDENWLGDRSPGENRDVVVLGVQADTAEDIAQATHEGQLHLSVVSEAARHTSSTPRR